MKRSLDRVVVFVGDTFTANVAYGAAGCYTPLYAVGTTYQGPFGRPDESVWQIAPDTIRWSDGIDLATLKTSAFTGAPYR